MTRQTARRRKGAPPPRRRDNTTLLIVGGVVAVILVALLVFINVSSQTASAPPLKTEGRTWGDVNSKVTIDEWSDFQ